MNKSVYVIGGAGFLGKYLVTILAADENLDVTCGDLKNPEIAGANYQYTNILDPDSLKKLGKSDIVINCTGQTSEPISNCLIQNSTGILNMIRELSVHPHLIQLSTVGVYGTTAIAYEDSPVAPETAYSTSKAIAEELLKYYVHANNLTILRLSNVYGLNQTKGILAYLLRSSHSDRILHLNHQPGLYRTFIHVVDVAGTIHQLISLNPIPSGIYNVAGDQGYSLADLVHMVESIKKLNFQVTWGNTQPFENIQYINIEKLKSIIPFQASYSLPDFIEQTF